MNERSLEHLEFYSKLQKLTDGVSYADIENICDTCKNKASCMRSNMQSPIKCLFDSEKEFDNLLVFLQVKKVKLDHSIQQRTQTNGFASSLLIKVNSNAWCKP